MEPGVVVATNNDDSSSVECPLDRSTLPTEAVLQAVASLKHKRIDQLETVYDVLDPDALNTLFSESARSAITVQFEYEGCTVEVTRERVRATAVR